MHVTAFVSLIGGRVPHARRAVRHLPVMADGGSAGITGSYAALAKQGQ
jgi:hypothetical protein